MKLNKKKGFTIVELVIVIAIIAVLAAVLIPTFVRLIRKSKINSDTQLIKHLNSALAADAVDHEHNTMTDALNAANDFGFSVDKINAKVSENEIYWDSKNDVFCYYNDGVIEYIPESVNSERALKADEQYMLWEIVDKALTDEQIANLTHSVYLASQAAADSFNNKTVHVGVDTGNYTVANLTYENTTSTAKNIVIRTNSFDTALTINAPVDTVKHYDAVGSLNIVAVANASYHENGQVKFVEISKGRIALEKGAEVSHIHINAKVENNVKQDVFEEIIISKEATVEMPDFSRDDVEIATTGTLVVALQTGTEDITTTTELDYVWLTKQGVYEQITVSESKTDAGSTWVNTSDKPAETKTAAQQIANNIGATATVGEVTYDVGVNEDRDIVLIEQGSETVAYTLETQTNGTTELKDGNGDAVDSSVATVESLVTETVEAQPDKAVVETGATLFAGGTGTEKDPYLISNREEFENIPSVTNYSYFKWVGASQIDASNWNRNMTIRGSFDGNGVIFNNLNSWIFRTVRNDSQSGTPDQDTVNTYTIKNLTANVNIIDDGWTAGVVRTAGVHNFVMENVNVHGYIEGASGVASFVCFGSGNMVASGQYAGHITFINCNSDAILYAKSGNAVGFLAHAMHTAAGSITIQDSNYTGSMSAPSASACKYGNGNWLNGSITDNQSSEKNNVIYKMSDNGWTYKAEGKTGSFTTSNGTLPANIGDSFELAAVSGATKAIVSIVISPAPGNMTNTYASEEILVDNGTFTSDQIKYFTVRINASGVTEQGIHGNYYDVVNPLYNGKIDSTTIVRITQYNANGSILSITNYRFTDGCPGLG